MNARGIVSANDLRQSRTRSLAPSRVQAWARGKALAVLEGLQHGSLVLVEGSTRTHVGQGQPSAEIRVHVPRFWSDLVLGGSVAAAESYIDGLWDSPDLVALVRLLCRNRVAMMRLDGQAGMANVARRLYHWLRPNTRSGARKNIQAHYDIGNDLFQLMLDPAMQYSSAVFASPSTSLADAQTYKMDLICQRLQLHPDDHLMEIGTGWGGLAIHAASRYGCRVTTTTISQAQFQLATERVAAAGLKDRVTVLCQDYRDVSGTYSKLVSVEMIEAIGKAQYGQFFATCQRLLRPDGQALIQAITIADQEFRRAAREVDFIKRWIFPGCCIPSLTAMTQAATQASDLRVHEVQEYGAHYARTLRLWRETCEQESEQIARLGYSERFRRLWRYYLAYCEGGFAERALGLVHLHLARPGWRSDAHRDL